MWRGYDGPMLMLRVLRVVRFDRRWAAGRCSPRREPYWDVLRPMRVRRLA